MYFWPTTLPQEPSVPGFSGRERDDIARSELGYGAAYIRDRTDFVVRPTIMHFILTTAEIAILDDFYTNTLKGVRSFDWEDHRTGEFVTYRFMSPPVYTPYGTTNWTVNLQFEIMFTSVTSIPDGSIVDPTSGASIIDPFSLSYIVEP